MRTRARRVTKAAGAVLAGVAIPIAAAASAWADETETIQQLESQGLSYADAFQVWEAEHTDTPVEVSYDGHIVVMDHDDGQAQAFSGLNHDVAVAIGDDTRACAGIFDDIFCQGISPKIALLPPPSNGSYDTAYANGDKDLAFAGQGNYDSASAIGTGAQASAGNGNHDSAVASGFAQAGAAYGNYDSATAVNTGVNTNLGDFLAKVIASAGGHDSSVLGNYDTASAVGPDHVGAFAGSNVGSPQDDLIPSSYDTAIVYDPTGTTGLDVAGAGGGDYDVAKAIGDNLGEVLALGANQTDIVG